jgi:putative flavoprotein involved in K+ transport
MIRTTAVVVGAGHAGLAMSRRLTDRSIDHVVLERGEVANSWRTQRWPSLRLLTPNWQTRLPGHDYAGDDPDGYMPAAGVAATLTGYARLVAAPVRTATTVHTVRAAPQGFEVHANDDAFYARTVVLATGACNLPAIPGVADAVPPSIMALTPLAYRDPGQLPDGGVLVVGASATGVQLASEVHRSGRPVTLAAGEHVRLPRTYRGRDIFWWLEATGLLAERYDQVDDLTRARHLPSPQLTGTPARDMTDLNTGGPVLRVPRQYLRARRPEDEPVPQAGRPVGHSRGPRRRAPATAPLRTHSRRPPDAPGARPDQRGDHLGAVGDGLPARPLLARHPRA